MRKTKRGLEMADVAAILERSSEAGDAREVYREIERISQECVGWRLLTVLRYVEADAAVERLYSSDEQAYPVGGRKPLDKIAASHAAMEKGDVFLAATREEVRTAFFDHELIFSLGISAILNAPIRQRGRRLGTLNFCGEEGAYGSAEVASARILAGLVAPSLLSGGD
jgi:GAF domain-containing protein